MMRFARCFVAELVSYRSIVVVVNLFTPIDWQFNRSNVERVDIRSPKEIATFSFANFGERNQETHTFVNYLLAKFSYETGSRGKRKPPARPSP